jgi:hypothetical protein
MVFETRLQAFTDAICEDGADMESIEDGGYLIYLACLNGSMEVGAIINHYMKNI